MRVFETDIANVDSFYFPAASEIRALARDRLPNGFKRIDRERIWRFANPSDFLSYDNRLSDFIELYGDNGAYSPDATGGTIDLMKHLAAGGLPDDFTVIYGWYSEGGCATGLGWVFEYLPRIPIVEAMIVENASTRPVSLSALTGSRTEGGLRKPVNAAGNPAIITNLDRKLAPGERVLVATSLLFAPSDVLREFTSSTYTYGPALAVTGVIVDRERVDFTGRSANFTELSLLFEEGSCPYLMSWSEVEGEWIDRGKVLHAATGRANQEREVVAYEGLRTRFRLEEREPEVANIDEAFLVLHMNDGRTLEIRPLLSSLADLDDVTATFHWGESVEFDFILGPEVDPSAVARSELHLTGHYERYSDMPILAAADGASDVLPPAGRAAPLVCPPVRREVKATPFDVF